MCALHKIIFTFHTIYLSYVQNEGGFFAAPCTIKGNAKQNMVWCEALGNSRMLGAF